MSTITAARTLIETAKLPDLMALTADAPQGGGLPALTDDQQALVIGSDVVSFTTGVEAEFRQAIANSALFAQLVALHKVGDSADPMAFFDVYFSTLIQLGWLVQKRDTAQVDVDNAGFDVHGAVIGVIEAFLAPIAGAAAVVLAVLKGLQQMNQDKPFITLFNKQSRREKLGRFQFTYVHDDPDHGLTAEIAAFALKASKIDTQILFFKLNKSDTQLRRSLGTLSIDTEALKALKPNLAAKVKDFRIAFIAEADLGPVPADV